MIYTNINTYLEQKVNNLTLYRGEEKEFLNPMDSDYKFFSEDKSFAEDYGDFIWKCIFKPLNLFISYKKESIEELYNNGFKLRDGYIESNWDKEGTSSGEIIGLYDYDETKSFDTFGYKSPKHIFKSPFFASDTWEMIEHSHGVLDYILSKYDGVSLLEGGQETFLIRTDKIINCERI